MDKTKSTPENGASAAVAPVVTERHAYLMGRPPMDGALGFLTRFVARPLEAAEAAAAWRKANDVVMGLGATEGNLCDSIEVRALPKALERQAKALYESRVYKNTFSFVPSTIQLVELAKLVVYQRNVQLDGCEALISKLGTGLSVESLFEIAFTNTSRPPVTRAVTNNNTIQFSSPSNDLRFLEWDELSPETRSLVPSSGNPAGVVGLVVGYGANFLNAVRINSRLILHNGMHRAYALLRLGYTHVPCLVQHVTRGDEIPVVLGGRPDYELQEMINSPRPALLKDFMDPRLTRVVELSKRMRVVKVSWMVEAVDVPVTQ